jgi:protein-tyrosine phosphatase
MATRKAPRRPRSPPKSNASQIAPGVYVGGWNDAEPFQGTRICVLDEVPDGKIPAEIHVPIYDEKTDRPLRENLDRVAQLVEAARQKNEPVLLFCGHGVRRGSLAGAWYLHRHDGLSLDAAFDRVRAVRPKIQHVKDWVGDWTVLAES